MRTTFSVFKEDNSGAGTKEDMYELLSKSITLLQNIDKKLDKLTTAMGARSAISATQ